MSGRTIVLGGLGNWNACGQTVKRRVLSLWRALLRVFDTVVLRVQGRVLGNVQGIPAVVILVKLFLANRMMSGH